MLITWNIPFLVKHTTINAVFLSRLVGEGLATHEAIEQHKSENNSSKFPYLVFQEVDKEGKHVIEKLVDILLETGNIKAANVLSPTRVKQHENGGYAKREVPLLTRLNENGDPSIEEFCTDGCVSSKTSSEEPDDPPFSIQVVPATKLFKGENIYHISPGSVRGQALIINNENFQELSSRRGSQVDVANLFSLFTQLGFQVNVKEDLKRSETLNLLIDFSENKGHESGDMMILVVLSHGQEGGKIITQDEKTVDINQDILRHFNNENCPSLRGKPKLFIFQACKGDEWDMGVQSRGLSGKTETDAKPFDIESPPGSPLKDPTWEDMVISYATIPGYVSWRSPLRGSWFIETLCAVFMKQSHDTNLRDMLDLVCLELKQRESTQGGKQSSMYEVRGFHKKLFFYPLLKLP